MFETLATTVSPVKLVIAGMLVVADCCASIHDGGCCKSLWLCTCLRYSPSRSHLPGGRVKKARCHSSCSACSTVVVVVSVGPVAMSVFRRLWIRSRLSRRSCLRNAVQIKCCTGC